MPASSSCTRCRRPLLEDSASGLCPICLTTPGSPSTTPVVTGTSPQVEPVVTLSSVLEVVPPLDETVSAQPAADTRTAAPDGDTGPIASPDRLRRAAPMGYELLRRLGEGGMGEVYLARETTTDRTVAMKFLNSP